MLNSYFVGPLIAVVIGLIYFATKKGKEGGGFSFKKGGADILATFTVDFTALAAANRLDPVVGREDEITRLAQVMSRREKNNAILIGAPGVGKTAIVEGLASLIVKKQVPEHLQGDRLLSLDVAGLLSGTKYRGEFEERAKKIIDEVCRADRRIILFIDEIHTIIQSHGTEGAVNFSDILKPALARGDLQMIGATTPEEYEKYIKTDASLERRFQPVEVREPTEAETIGILKNVKDRYREFHKVEFTDAAIDAAVKLSQKYIVSRRLPDKALDVVDESGAMVKVSHVHPDVPAILFKTASEKYPEAAKLWSEIQELDRKIYAKKSEALTKRREDLEKQAEAMGVLVVDSDDIKKVVGDWRETE
ncbi:MAG: hypothetical protein A3J93_05020 [Candidatus Magasanikbacteria bacterium RIFOXYC2_FULL_42_28]|uniref:AAA+ ATPase domain-containing protein n=1 Tax=Candidatus Magasanikbacteria bacterium RIFOXYC2_FULL_42_28 TaxID=1798704 RepID=A0A1F6NV77_9BACT|nr:MAG: hypothetical protein A3J93_05020 [Candidatus Magasanikbacteria bacterium RIFOXYC2_FULL_42_28]